MDNYIAYNAKVCIPWFNKTPQLLEAVQKYKQILKDEGIEDKYAKIARMRVFYNIVCKDQELLKNYTEQVWLAEYVPYEDLVNELDALIRKVSWSKFFMALRYLVRRYIKLQTPDTLNSRRLDIALDKLLQVSHVTVIPKADKYF